MSGRVRAELCLVRRCGWACVPPTSIRSITLAHYYCRLTHSLTQIGVHHGYFWMSVALTARVGEKLFALDLFERNQVGYAAVRIAVTAERLAGMHARAVCTATVGRVLAPLRVPDCQ